MKKRFSIFGLLSVFILAVACKSQDSAIGQQVVEKQTTVVTKDQKQYEWKSASANGYDYKYVTNDPLKVRFYTLDNGLTVILAENDKKPRIAFNMAVRSGSNNDPKDHTGLAHYLEHMLFKGTDKFGSLDWSKEKPLLDKIENLYEQYNSTTDTEERKKIYKEIDEVSGEAAKNAIASEYDKLMSYVGSQGTNAWTWVEETVYTEDLPSNAVDKFLTIQAERFRNPQLRLFHTELEAVYEEKNGGFLNDMFVISEVALDAVFPTHNYGQQTTIGTIEHLKNPSLTAIKKYYNDNYIPNNMGVIMVGDFDSDTLIGKIDKAFAYMQPKEKNEYVGPKEAPINGPIVKDVYSPTPQSTNIFFRSQGAGTDEAVLVELASMVLSNGTAGLIDLNILMEQKLQQASASPMFNKDYGLLQFSGTPNEDQSLEDVKDLLLEQIELLKKGAFDESLLKAIVANNKLVEEEKLLYSDASIAELTDEFIKSQGENWDFNRSLSDKRAKISKEELVAFANTFFTDTNYAVVYKREGEDKDRPEVEKPPITAIETNAGKSSPFVQKMMESPIPTVNPVWVDFDTKIKKEKLGIADVLYVQNKDNSLFQLSYIFPFGTRTDKKLSVASDLFNYLGTDSMTSEEISQKFYSLACNFYVSVQDKETVINIVGLQENFDEAVALFEKFLGTCKADEVVLQGLKDQILGQREDNKIDKDQISYGLMQYAAYGPNNPFNDVLSEAEIENLKSEDLIASLHKLGSHKHKITYYGPSSYESLEASLNKLHKLPTKWTEIQAVPKTFKRVAQKENELLFANYGDAVQADVMWVRNLEAYNPEKEAIIEATNSYFGGGMGSIVFSTIRESKALAYSTFSGINIPSEKEENFSLFSYIGTQADKLNDAIVAMNELHNDLPKSEVSFNNTISGLKNTVETGRVLRSDYIDSYLGAQKKGLDYDIRKKNYTKYDAINFDDVKEFHKNSYANKPYTYCIIADKSKVDFGQLKKYAKVKELTLKELFGY